MADKLLAVWFVLMVAAVITFSTLLAVTLAGGSHW
jgi:hypothetical protein